MSSIPKLRHPPIYEERALPEAELQHFLHLTTGAVLSNQLHHHTCPTTKLERVRRLWPAQRDTLSSMLEAAWSPPAMIGPVIYIRPLGKHTATGNTPARILSNRFQSGESAPGMLQMLRDGMPEGPSPGCCSHPMAGGCYRYYRGEQRPRDPCRKKRKNFAELQ